MVGMEVLGCNGQKWYAVGADVKSNIMLYVIDEKERQIKQYDGK